MILLLKTIFETFRHHDSAKKFLMSSIFWITWEYIAPVYCRKMAKSWDNIHGSLLSVTHWLYENHNCSGTLKFPLKKSNMAVWCVLEEMTQPPLAAGFHGLKDSPHWGVKWNVWNRWGVLGISTKIATGSKFEYKKCNISTLIRRV